MSATPLTTTAALNRLRPLAERWEHTEEWHNPPFLDGTIHVRTADLRAISVVLKEVACLQESELTWASSSARYAEKLAAAEEQIARLEGLLGEAHEAILQARTWNWLDEVSPVPERVRESVTRVVLRIRDELCPERRSKGSTQ